MEFKSKPAAQSPSSNTYPIIIATIYRFLHSSCVCWNTSFYHSTTLWGHCFLLFLSWVKEKAQWKKSMEFMQLITPKSLAPPSPSSPPHSVQLSPWILWVPRALVWLGPERHQGRSPAGWPGLRKSRWTPCAPGHILDSLLWACHPISFLAFPICRQDPGLKPDLSHRKKNVTYHRGEEAAALYMLEGHGTKERSQEEEKGEEGNVWHCMTAGTTRVASLLDALRWRQQGCIDQA